MPYLYSYLIDENDDYVLTEGGDKIILEQVEYTIEGSDWRRIASSWNVPFVRAFAIKRTASGAWALTVNTLTYVGTYPDRNAAILVVLGLFTNASASDDGAEISMTWQLTTGASTIDELEEGDVGYEEPAPAGPWDAYRANDGAAWAGGSTQTPVTTTVAVSGAYDSIAQIHRATSTVLSPTPTSGVGTNGDDPPYISITDGTLWWTGSAGSHLGLEWRYNAVDATGPSTSLLELDFSQTIRIVYHDTYTAGDSAGWDPADAV